MGVGNFGSYLQFKRQLFFKTCKLEDCFLIVDGANISIEICKGSQVDPRFGNDYQTLCKEFHDLFSKLRLCGVKPIVLMDGYYSEEKEKTMENRKDNSLQNLRDYKVRKHNLQGNRSVAIFKTKAFTDVLNDLKICHLRCDFEADGEIAYLAKKLNCPVLSTDSDFAFFKDVTFIPYQNGLKLKGKPRHEYIECFQFNREEFLRHHDISFSQMQLFAIIFNNDYWNYNVFDGLQLDTGSGKTHEKIQSATNWLRGKSDEDAKKEIISLVVRTHDKNEADVKKAFEFALNSYSKTHTTLSEQLKRHPFLKNKLLKVQFDVKEVDLAKKYNVPDKLMNLVRECRIPSITLDMFTSNTYLCRPHAVEDIDKDSIYRPSIHLIQGMYGLIKRYYPGEAQPLKIKIRQGDIEHVEGYFALTFPKGELSKDQKNQILEEITCFKNHETLEYFDKDWYIFVLALIYIRKKCGVAFHENYVHGILLSAFLLQIIKKSENLNREREGVEDNRKEGIPSRYLEELRWKLCDSIAKKAKSWRITKREKRKLQNISHIHMYLTFKASLYHMIQVFTMLDLPDSIRVEDFLSGSFYHKIVTELEGFHYNWRDFIRTTFPDNFRDLTEKYDRIFFKLRGFLN